MVGTDSALASQVREYAHSDILRALSQRQAQLAQRELERTASQCADYPKLARSRLVLADVASTANKLQADICLTKRQADITLAAIVDSLTAIMTLTQAEARLHVKVDSERIDNWRDTGPDTIVCPVWLRLSVDTDYRLTASVYHPDGQTDTLTPAQTVSLIARSAEAVRVAVNKLARRY